MRLKTLLMLAGVLAAYHTSTAQSLDSNLSKVKFTARFQPLGILDLIDQNFAVGAEFRLSDKFSAGSDFAYVFSSAYLSESKAAKGILIRPFIKYYPDRSRYNFFEAQLHYKFVAYEIKDWIGRDITNGVPAYEEFSKFSYNKNVYGINIIAGTQRPVSRDKRFRTELYFGLGYRYKTQGASEGTYVRQSRIFLHLYDPTYSTVTLPMGISLVYDIK